VSAPPIADPKPKEEAVAPPKKIDTSITTKAAEHKGRIEQIIAEKGFTNRVKVQGSGNTLTLAGKLRPAEHSTLLQFLRDTPADVHIVDHIEYDDAPADSFLPPPPSYSVPPPPPPLSEV